MDVFLCIIGGPLFLGAAAVHLYIRFRLRPKEEVDSEECYHEFEDQDPDFARYERWLRITFAAAAVGVLLLFVAAVI